MPDIELELQDPELKALFRLMRDSTGFDREGFRTLVEDTDEKTVLNILARFRETLIAGLKAATEGKDGETLWRAFHKVAGSAELLGFKGLGLLCRELDALLRKTPDVKAYAAEIQAWQEVGRGVLKALDTQCPGLPKYLS